MSDHVKKLIVRPTWTGYEGVVVAECPTCAELVANMGSCLGCAACGFRVYIDCIVVDLTPEYARGYKHAIGETVAYTSHYGGLSGPWYETDAPDTRGT